MLIFGLVYIDKSRGMFKLDSPETPLLRAKPNTPRKLSYNVCVVLPFVLLLFFPQSIALYVEFVL